MKTLWQLVAITLLAAAGIAGAQVNLPNPGLPGGSFHTAIPIVATNEIMIDRFIKQWLRMHYPGWDAEPHEFQELGDERYAVVFITSRDNPARRVYFRVAKSPNDDDGAGFPL